MNFIGKHEAASSMNLMGSERRPFFFIIDYLQERCFVAPISDLRSEEVLYDYNGKTNVSSAFVEEKPVDWESFPMSEEDYSVGFRNVVSEMNRGNSYLINYTCSTPIQTNLTLEEIFHRSKAPYRLCLRGNFVMFSPEIFVKIEHGDIYSYPMKGTIDASVPDARETILGDDKESAEHATIVDLIRNDLSMVADRVEVTKYRFIDEITTNSGKLLQVSSEIKGTLPDDWTSRLGDIMFALLPAGSITGAPKKKTMEIIAASENYERGFYTGVTGIFDGKSLDSAVMIRFIEQQECGKMCFKSGGGITARSNQHKEYEEMKRKIYVPFRIH